MARSANGQHPNPPEARSSRHTFQGTPAVRVGYLLKMYPRFSETFILTEILELERQGVSIDIFSLKKPDDGRFHADLADVQASVTYVPDSPVTGASAYLAAHRHVFREDRKRYLRVMSIALRRRRWGTFKRFLQAGYLVPRLRERGITHLHAHFASSATSVAGYITQLTGIPYSFTAHAKDIYSDSVVEHVLARKLALAAFCVTVSDYNHAHLARLAGTTPLHRIYNGLDLTTFSQPAAPTAVRDTPPLILGVGRLVEKKGFLDLIRACAELRDRGVAFKCQIVGKGPDERALRKEISRLNLEDFVTLPGPLPRGKLIALYPRASAFVAPCTIGQDGNRDGLPTVLIEAMALGVPAVATPVTGIPELVRDGRTGLIAPSNDSVALADQIARLLDDPLLAQQLAANARCLVEREFDIVANVAALRQLYLGRNDRPTVVPRQPTTQLFVSNQEGVTSDAPRLSLR